MPAVGCSRPQLRARPERPSAGAPRRRLVVRVRQDHRDLPCVFDGLGGNQRKNIAYTASLERPDDAVEVSRRRVEDDTHVEEGHLLGILKRQGVALGERNEGDAIQHRQIRLWDEKGSRMALLPSGQGRDQEAGATGGTKEFGDGHPRVRGAKTVVRGGKVGAMPSADGRVQELKLVYRNKWGKKGWTKY